MINQLTAICKQAMRVPIAPDDDLIAHRLNSNQALKIIKALWVAHGIELDVNVFYTHRTVRTVVAAIESGQHATIEKIFILREGLQHKPLFVYAGGINCFLEMQDMISALRYDGVVYAIGLTDFHRPGDNPACIADETRASYDAIKSICPDGPVRLLGFSFGGVLALELARKLMAEGKTIGLLAMIDAPQNDHSWRWRDWALLMSRIVLRQLKARLKPKPKGRASPSKTIAPATENARPRFNHQIFFRFRNPRNPRYPVFAPQWADGHPPRYTRAGKQILQMKGLYRPKTYGDDLVFIHSKGGALPDCDARHIWERYLTKTDWICVDGNHLSMMVGRHGRKLAAHLDDRLGKVDVQMAAHCTSL